MLARWAQESIQSFGKALVRTTPSLAVRACNAAREDGIDLTGATFTTGSEPTTQGKMNVIASVGARALPIYAAAETGMMGVGCAQPIGASDQHLCRDLLALIHQPRDIPGLGLAVDAFMVTSLSETAPKVLLNVEIDDYGVVKERDCGCLFGQLGYSTHLREVHSFSKLTGEGVTLVNSDMIRILEELLPARFGGTSLDYQLIEEEDERGMTKLSIVVDPKVQISNDQDVIDSVLNALKSAKGGVDGALFERGKTFRVKRMSPIPTVSGKLMPLYSIRK